MSVAKTDDGILQVKGMYKGMDITSERNAQGTDITRKRNVQGTDITS